MASTDLKHTFSSGNRKTWTFSAWIKLNGFSGTGFFAAYASGTNRSYFGVNGSNQLLLYAQQSGSDTCSVYSTQVFRDPSAWYHIMCVCDTTQSTSTNRVKFYVNGSQADVTFSHTPDQNEDLYLNSAVEHSIGSRDDGSTYFDGSMTHVHFTDGYAYTPSTFGETDSTSGIWKPKTAPSVTYGTNGFFLKFENSGAMGTDSSGNSNTFTTSGTITQNVDTPSNVFATLNSIYQAKYQPTFSTGNLTATAPNSGEYYPAFSTLGIETGKFYMEYEIGAAGSFHVGVSAQVDTDTSFPYNDRYLGETSKSVGVAGSNGSSYIAGSATSYGSSYTSGDILGLALDMTNKKLYVSKNGTFYNSGNPASGSNGIDISGILSSGDYAFFGHSCYGGSGSRTIEANFGQGFFGTTAVASANADANGFGAFEYAVPSGYYALCTKNIKEFG